MKDVATGTELKKAIAHDARPSGKQRLLEAAERLFASKGFSGVSAAELAREAQVAHGLLFHHFGSMEDLYAEVSRAAAQRMDRTQAESFRGRTAQEQIASFLRAHMRSVKQRQGDAVFRARSHNMAINSKVVDIWEASRQQAISRICLTLGKTEPSEKERTLLRAWIGFHDQLVLAWLADKSITEADVLEWTLGQLKHLASDVLHVNLESEPVV